MLTVVAHFILVVAFDIPAIVWLMLMAVVAQLVFFAAFGIRVVAHKKMLAVLVAVVVGLLEKFY